MTDIERFRTELSTGIPDSIKQALYQQGVDRLSMFSTMRCAINGWREIPPSMWSRLETSGRSKSGRWTWTC
ncbi:MAG: hypothetical protein WDM77_16275 [Steroidobacteraceae bacterium]